MQIGDIVLYNIGGDIRKPMIITAIDDAEKMLVSGRVFLGFNDRTIVKGLSGAHIVGMDLIVTEAEVGNSIGCWRERD